MPETPYVYVFVRTDIPLADQIVQVGHSCINSGRDFQHPDDTHMCLLALKDEEALGRAATKLIESNIRFTMFYEPDDNMGYTSLTTEAIYSETRDLFKKYTTWS